MVLRGDKVKRVGPAFSYWLEKSKRGEKKMKRFPFISKPSNENPLQNNFQIFQI